MTRKLNTSHSLALTPNKTMTRIKVNTTIPYEVSVGGGVINELGEFIVNNFPKATKIALVADSNVDALHGNRVGRILEGTGKCVERITFQAGEKSKTLKTYSELLNALATFRFSRKDIIVALGGGVTGDLSGFAAATYMRGIDFIQVPTSLLAMVDSSVGGKTGVNMDLGKNLVGAFHQPRAVFCDTDFLKTLPDEWRADGMGEVLKYAVLGDADLFANLESAPTRLIGEPDIARCIAMKRDIVNRDEREGGERKLLNLGHTFAHAIEKTSGFTISHGQAVATGIVMAARTAEKEGILNEESAKRIKQLAKAMGYRTQVDISDENLKTAMLSDKKAAGSTIDLILPIAIGRCTIKPTQIN